MEPNNQCLVHISNLPDNANEEFLYNILGDENIKNVTLKNKNGCNFAFVEFQTPKLAQEAIEEFNYIKVNGVSLTFTLASTENLVRIMNGVGIVFVNNIDPKIEESQLHELFSNFGEVVSCRVPMDGDLNRGFGYVQFANEESAYDAIDQLNGALINETPIQVSLYQKKAEPPVLSFMNRKSQIDDKFMTVFLRNVPSDEISTLAQFVELFANFGTVTHAKYFKEKNAGFCRMSTHETAVMAMNRLNGRVIGSSTLYACRALTREEIIAYNKLK